MPPTDSTFHAARARTIAAFVAIAVAVSACAVSATSTGGPDARVAAETASPSIPPARTPAPTPPPSPSVAPSPSAAPVPTPETTPPPTGPFEMNLYRRNDFASQATKDTCVAGAMLTMLNVGDATDRHDDDFQLSLASLALRLSGGRAGETEPEGWAAGLEVEGLGPYVVDVAPSRYAAVVRAARAIRATGRPVGLLVWRGAHSWVMHGFVADTDPAVDRDARITDVWVTDPWYPRVSSIWGPSNRPNTLVPVEDLAIDYLPWRRPTGRYPDKDGKYVLVLPVTAP